MLTTHTNRYTQQPTFLFQSWPSQLKLRRRLLVRQVCNGPLLLLLPLLVVTITLIFGATLPLLSWLLLLAATLTAILGRLEYNHMRTRLIAKSRQK